MKNSDNNTVCTGSNLIMYQVSSLQISLFLLWVTVHSQWYSMVVKNFYASGRHIKICNGV